MRGNLAQRASLSEETLRFLEELRSRHANRASDCGALLAEILSGKDRGLQARAARIYASLGCKRGSKRLRSLTKEVVERFDAHRNSEDLILLRSLLLALGSMDAPEAHARLAEALATTANPEVAALILESMGYEREVFEPALVLPFLSPRYEPEVIVSALYALESNSYARKEPSAATLRISPLLKHKSPQVRRAAVSVLAYWPDNRDLIRQLENDPDRFVREGVSEASHVCDLLRENG